MLDMQLGLTKTYNLFHDPGIETGAKDLSALDTQLHPTRREVLKRLLDLNHKRHAEEMAEGWRHRSIKYGIRRVALFGSTARGDARPDSDVDLLLEFETGRKTFDTFMAAAEILEETFPVHVDVLTPESFNDWRRARILSESVHLEIQS